MLKWFLSLITILRNRSLTGLITVSFKLGSFLTHLSGHLLVVAKALLAEGALQLEVIAEVKLINLSLTFRHKLLVVLVSFDA